MVKDVSSFSLSGGYEVPPANVRRRVMHFNIIVISRIGFSQLSEGVWREDVVVWRERGVDPELLVPRQRGDVGLG